MQRVPSNSDPQCTNTSNSLGITNSSNHSAYIFANTTNCSQYGHFHLPDRCSQLNETECFTQEANLSCEWNSTNCLDLNPVGIYYYNITEATSVNGSAVEGDNDNVTGNVSFRVPADAILAPVWRGDSNNSSGNESSSDSNLTNSSDTTNSSSNESSSSMMNVTGFFFRQTESPPMGYWYIYNESGFYLQNETNVTIPPLDGTSILRVNTKIENGFFFKKTKVFPKD